MCAHAQSISIVTPNFGTSDANSRKPHYPKKNCLRDDVINKHHHDWPRPNYLEGQREDWIIYLVKLWQ